MFHIVITTIVIIIIIHVVVVGAVGALVLVGVIINSEVEDKSCNRNRSCSRNHITSLICVNRRDGRPEVQHILPQIVGVVVIVAPVKNVNKSAEFMNIYVELMAA